MATVKRLTGDYTIQTISSGDVVTVESTNVNIIGNLTVTGNASLSGNVAADKIFNGTTSIEIQTINGNANVTVGGTSNVLVIANTGAFVSGLQSVTGNITGANLITAGLATVTGNITGANINTAGNVWISRDASLGQPTIRFTDTDTDIADGQVFGAVEWFTNDVSLTGPRVTAGIRAVANGLLGNANVQILTSTNGAAATPKVTVDNVGNVGVANTAPLHTLAVSGTVYSSSTMTVVGNVQGGNLRTVGQVTATGNVTGGNVLTAGLVTATGNVTGGNIISLGAVSASTGGVSSVGNVTGGNINSIGVVTASGNITGSSLIAAVGFNTVGNVSATGNVFGGNVSVVGNVTTANIAVSSALTGGGLAVPNYVYQSVDSNFTSATPATLGSLQFNAVANQAFRFDAYITLVPTGSTTVSPAVSFSAGTCNYTTELQTTSTSAYSVATKTTSDNVTTTYSSTGTDARTLKISGWFFHTANTTVAMRFQTSAANVTVKTGSYLVYTRIA